VNTVVIDGSTLRGYNTDGGGMVMACQEAGIELSGRRVLLLGAGGAIAVAFGGAGIGELNIANRSAEHAIELQNKLRGVGMEKVLVCPLDALDEAVLETEIIVNATSLGMKEGDPLPMPAGYVEDGKAVCDAVYRPGTETSLVRLARERGARVATGKRMLLYQGVLRKSSGPGENLT
jgi:shikimate dehydrogenase